MPATLQEPPTIVTDDRLAVIDDAGLGAQASYRLGDQPGAPCEVSAGTAVEPHLVAGLAGDNAEAVVLDFANPEPARRHRVGFGGHATGQ
jgi:hypothetical protein